MTHPERDHSAAGLQRLLDRAAIQDVLTRYFGAADRGDKDAVRACFTDDVRARYDGRAPVSGVDALMAQIPLFDDLASGACRSCTHFMGNLQFKQLECDQAETETNAIAYLVRAGEPGDQVHMRSLRYLDRFVRRDGAWKIGVRIHTLDWACMLPASAVRAFPQRLNTIPGDLSSG